MKPGLSRLSTIFAAAVMAAGTLVTPAFAQSAATPDAPEKAAPMTIVIPSKALPATLPPGIITIGPTKPKADDTKKADLPPFPFTKAMMDETDGGKRIVRIEGEINAKTAATVEAQLIALDKADPGKPILLAINSPGGSVTAGLDIIDTMNSLQSPVYTAGFNMCASMAAVLLTAGESGHRTIFPNTTFMIHEEAITTPEEGVTLKTSELRDLANEIERNQDKLLTILADHTGQKKEDIFAFIQRQDKEMSAAEAQKTGFVDTIEKPTHPIVPPAHIVPIRSLGF